VIGAPLRLWLQAPSLVAAPGLSVRGVWRERQAVRIRMHDAQGHRGLGEALPLPGYSRDDAAAVHAMLSRLAAQLSASGLVVPPAAPGAAQIEAALAPLDAVLAAAPGARFALECALLDLLSRRAGLAAAAWLAEGRPLHAVPVSVLLPDAADEAVAEAGRAAARGHRVLKLKIARADRSAAQEDRLCADVRAAAEAAAPGRVRLRLDANGALDAAQLPARLAALSRHGIELVEEPVSGAALLDLPPLPMPWAADESLADPQLCAALLRLPPGRRPAVLVLKPAELGLVRCLALAAEAAAQGLGLIVTHSLDGEPGLAAARALAAALPVAPWPCGLAPHPGLRRPAPSQAVLAPPLAPGLGLDDDGGEAP